MEGFVVFFIVIFLIWVIYDKIRNWNNPILKAESQITTLRDSLKIFREKRNVNNEIFKTLDDGLKANQLRLQEVKKHEKKKDAIIENLERTIQEQEVKMKR